jgi:hypothetical protein
LDRHLQAHKSAAHPCKQQAYRTYGIAAGRDHAELSPVLNLGEKPGDQSRTSCKSAAMPNDEFCARAAQVSEQFRPVELTAQTVTRPIETVAAHATCADRSAGTGPPEQAAIDVGMWPGLGT